MCLASGAITSCQRLAGPAVILCVEATLDLLFDDVPVTRLETLLI